VRASRRSVRRLSPSVIDAETFCSERFAQISRFRLSLGGIVCLRAFDLGVNRADVGVRHCELAFAGIASSSGECIGSSRNEYLAIAKGGVCITADGSSSHATSIGRQNLTKLLRREVNNQ
jgi:hypothetical protein